MIARTVLLLLLPIIAAVALTRRRRLACVIGMGLLSLVLAATYLLLHAPDVAVTEAAKAREDRHARQISHGNKMLLT